MIGYLDTSAVVPILIAEESTTRCRRFWDDAGTLTSTRLLYVECAAALAQALRMGRLDLARHDAGRLLLERLWADIDVIELDAALMGTSADMAGRHSLRGYDSVHCAGALAVNDPELVAASGDQRLLAAWTALGVAVYDTNATSS